MDTQNKINFKSEIIAKNYLKDLVDNYLIDLIEKKFPGCLIYKSPRLIKKRVNKVMNEITIANEDVTIEITNSRFKLFLTYWKFGSKDESDKFGRMTVLIYNEILYDIDTEFVTKEIYNNLLTIILSKNKNK